MVAKRARTRLVCKRCGRRRAWRTDVLYLWTTDRTLKKRGPRAVRLCRKCAEVTKASAVLT